MDEDEQQEEEVNPLLGGFDDIDNIMIETTFDLSAYLSDNKDNNNVDSDDDDSHGLPLGVRNHDQEASQSCTYLTGPKAPEVSISIDGVDYRLLNRACQEVPAVLLKMERRICRKRFWDIGNFSPGDCLKAFMYPHFLGYMKSNINSNMQSDVAVSSSDIIAFIRVELMISIYKVRRMLLDVNYAAAP